MRYALPFIFILTSVFLVNSCTLKTSDIVTQDNTILDAYWMLVSLEGQDVPMPSDSRTAFIRFQEKENDVHGFTGCNKFFGKYTLGEESLALSELRATRMACAGMENENKFLDVLSRVDSYRISKNVLTLYDDDKAVATFMTGNPDTLDNDPGRY
ncbi:META domain-containing protein [Pontibacter locisalis]|uniref:META domain-containing protein n=1 Tax=Pontibacter locisalis TaxID=1719035 RepID=A0ABW5INT0_9BACT